MAVRACVAVHVCVAVREFLLAGRQSCKHSFNDMHVLLHARAFAVNRKPCMHIHAARDMYIA